MTRAAAIALAYLVPIVGGACTDDADETRRGDETLERVDAEIFMEVDADEGEIHETRARLAASPDAIGPCDGSLEIPTDERPRPSAYHRLQ